MPPKKTKKNKEPKGPPEKVYEFLTLDEIKAREQKYSNRLSDLRVCLNFIDDAIIQIEELNEQQLIADKWQEYLTCNPLPKPYQPPNIRMFLTKLKFFEEKQPEANIDWPLAVNERSILTQSIFRKNLTRMNLKEKLKPEFGMEYNEDINNCLSVIRRTEYFLDNDFEVAKCSPSILHDIKELKFSLQKYIGDFLDCYTYRILCSEEAYMNSVDTISSEYCFSGDHFQIHIWSLKNVPIRFSHLDEPRLVADLHNINIRLHIPSTMLYENFAIRAIHMDFDHVSEKAKSSSHVIVPAVNLNAGIQDLHECLINEWLMQLEIQGRIREEMVQKRLEYEEKLREYEEEQTKKGKENKMAKDEGTKSGKKGKAMKMVKPGKEPPIIDADIFPDIYEDFLEEEQKQYENFINQIYNPDLLDLDSDEINLKKFFILGGIYQLEYVTKPPHTDFDFNGFNMTWHHNGTNLKIEKDLYIPSIPRFLSKRSTRLMSSVNLLRSSEPLKDSTDPECPWFVMTVKLPEYLCYWGEPIACHYEITEKVLPQEKKEPPIVGLELTRKSQPLSISIASPTKDIEVQHFSPDSLGIKPSIHDNSLARNIPRRIGASSGFSQGNFFQSALSLRISLTDGQIPRRPRSSDGTLNIQDFQLSPLLNKDQIRHLERHCLPRIISSFKFPNEIKEELVEASRTKPKTKAGLLLRKQAESHDIGDGILNRALAYNDFQNNPERVFALYSPHELIRIIGQLQDDEDNAIGENFEPESFLELMRLLNSIKHQYKLRVRKILDLKPFKSKMKWQNKRLKQFFKKYDRKFIQSSISMDKNAGRTKRLISKSKSDDVKYSLAKDSKRDLQNEGNKIQIVEPSISEDTSYDSSIESTEDFSGIKKTQIVTYSHWTTKHILKSEFNREKHTMVIQTDRLGSIGFAFKRYEHLPFKYWSLEPSEENPDNEIVFTLETQYVRCVLYCTANGIRGHVTEPTKRFVRNPKMYLKIEKPIKDYKEFKKMFKDNYLNIFAEHDACYYIENGYFSEKHLATEIHTYSCMAIHSTQMKFNFSQWNRLAKRRDIVLKFIQMKDLAENMVEVRITPEEAFFVEISELCSDDLDVIKLDYALTWRNIGVELYGFASFDMFYVSGCH
ncbi:uncharacterized protein LOC142222650 isoform X2 [Haematobia irritans]|uniref:uncharacterized protein LOC142222650 isoform X2 n=1 Tax=Haematobia irritans TaxID=7368 RepID=UPI003F50D0D1